MGISYRFRNQITMSNIISYVKAQGELDCPDYGKVIYELNIRPTKTISPNKLQSFKDDVEDFERYLNEKYVIEKVHNIDKFAVWQRLRDAIKRIL